jgi:hypothetical protein
MRRIISMLVIARLIQRLVNGSRGPARPPSRSQQGHQPSSELPQGGPTVAGAADKTGDGKRERTED